MIKSFLWVNLLLTLFFVLSNCKQENTYNISLNEFLSNSVVKSISYIEKEIDPKDSILLIIPKNLGVINKNIPIKKDSLGIYFITSKRNIVKYYFNKSGIDSMPNKICQIPNSLGLISDFELFENFILLIDTKENVIKYNFKLNDYELIIQKGGDYLINSKPYIGMGIIKNKNAVYISAVKSDFKREGCFLSKFNLKLDYASSLGNFVYEEQSCFSPFFDSPQLSNVVEDSIIYMSLSSNSTICKAIIKDKIEFKKTFSSPKSPVPFCLNKKKVTEYNYMDSSYVSSGYWYSLYANNTNLYRVFKNKQSYLNRGMKKNTVLNSSWILDKIDLNSGKVTRFNVDKDKYCFSLPILYNDLIYFYKYTSNDEKIWFYSFD